MNKKTSCGLPVVCRAHGNGKDKCDFYAPIVLSEERMNELREAYAEHGIKLQQQQLTLCQHAGSKNSAGNRLCENPEAISAFVETLFPHLKCTVEEKGS